MQIDRVAPQEMAIKHLKLANQSTFTELEKKYYTQRFDQRSIIFWLSIGYVGLFSLFVFILIFWQGFLRANTNGDVEIVSQLELQTLIVSLFGQFLAVIIIITRAVWDGSEPSNWLKTTQPEKK